MNKLEKLIAKLCPNGVEYKPLGDVCHYSAERISSSAVDAHSFVCVESLLQERRGRVDAISVPSEGNVIAFNEGDVLVGNIRPYLKKIWLADLDGGTNGDVLVIQRNDKPKLTSKYLYHVLASDDFFKHDMQFAKGAKMPRGDKDAVMKFEIPLPPLPVQDEIVRMLDDMSGLIGELENELVARKQQYEWCRDRVLNTAGRKCREVTLGEVIVSLNTGLNPRKFFKLNTPDAKNYYVTIREMHGGRLEFSNKTDRINDSALKLCNRRSNLEVGDLLFSGTGTIGEMAVIDEKPDNWNIKEGVYTIKPIETRLDSHYLRYVLMSQSMRAKYLPKASGGTVKSIPMTEIRKIEIPLPPLAEQKKIVAQLEGFDKLCNSMTEGLPGEIALRKQQYEYYRDKLLTFKRAG